MEKVAIVTGASRDVGKEVAYLLSSEGYHVVLVSRSQEKLDEVKKNITNEKGSAEVFCCDISDENKVYSLVDEVVKKHGKIDLLFDNAGIYVPGTSEVKLEKLKKVVETNLLGTIYMANAVASYMKKQQSGYIMIVSSVAGKSAKGPIGAYACTKFGLVGYGEALFQEMLSYNVKVTTLCPGAINTDMIFQVVDASRMHLEELIQPADIALAVKCLLQFGHNIAIPEFVIHATFTERTRNEMVSQAFKREEE